MKTVLFLCTGNSCRSQMSEAVVTARHPEWKAYSAGTKPAGYVHELAIESLKEIGISHEGVSKNIDDLPTKDFDLVVTVCDSAAEECTIWPGRAGATRPLQLCGSRESGRDARGTEAGLSVRAR